MESKDYGLIYVLTNECMPGIVKIGQTTKKNVEERMRSLYYGATGVPVNFTCAKSYKVPLDKLDALEKKLHAHFAEFRVNPDREFFRVTPDDVEKLFFVYNEIMEDATAEVQNEIDKVTKADEVAEEAKRKKAPNMDFLAMGLPVGTVLRFKKDTSISCTISSHNRVDYQDRHGVSLSALTKELLGTPYGVQPSPYWMTEDGRLLIDIYKEYTRAHVANAQAQCKEAAKYAKETVDAAHAISDKCQQIISDTNHG